MMTATYSPEDNKLRLYATSRLDSDTYARVKAAGFKWAPKQELFVAPAWTPSREDLLVELCGEIGDEDYSPEERAADRAERFEGYRDKRREEAGDRADTFEAGPSAFGHQSRQRAERQAARHDRHRVNAVSQWSKAEYWQTRTAGVIRHALHKSSASVRRGRILRLETDRRKMAKDCEEYRKRREGWQQVLTLEGSGVPLVVVDSSSYIGIDRDKATPAGLLAYAMANTGATWAKYTHPRTGREASIYDLLRDAADPVTPAEAASLWLARAPDTQNPMHYLARWSAHYDLRLTYEKAMLAEEGGTAGDAEMEVGGWLGSHQIHKVNKSPATGRVVSVTLKVSGDRWGNSKEGHHMRAFNIERLPEGAYRAPTDEERDAFKVATKQSKAEAKAKAPKAPPFINPTDEDAERLQAILNSHERDEGRHSKITRMTQEEYSARSKGTYSPCETVLISERLQILRHYYSDQQRSGRVGVFKVRTGSKGWNSRSVVVLTDKPQSAIPWDLVEEAAAKMPNENTHGRQMVEFFARRVDAGYEFCNLEENERERFKQLRSDFGYLGWCNISCANQCDLTTEGAKVLEKWRAREAARELVPAGQLF